MNLKTAQQEMFRAMLTDIRVHFSRLPKIIAEKMHKCGFSEEEVQQVHATENNADAENGDMESLDGSDDGEDDDDDHCS
ncbi:hypothetical protein BGX28_002082, partial [Mortierella sp. GBA30]